jgi:hypothetical protein
MWPSRWAIDGPSATCLTRHVRVQVIASACAPPSVATSRSPVRSGACQRGGADTEDDVIAGVRIAGRQPVGHKRTPSRAEVRRDEAAALHADVPAGRQA